MADTTPKSILVVDDDPQVLSLMADILSDAGYRVLEARDGRHAMAAIRKGPVDVMVTDLIMPEQEGVETITQLKKEYPGIRIVAISGAAEGAYLKLAELLGAHAVLRKPFAPGQLLDQIAKVLA
ncbi:MAG: response regulator [Acidobacteria bacterium]|nr:response regulator [Acidobacteriota bacterium]